MLEIILLVALGKRVGAIVRAKGHRAGGYQLLLVVLWFGGEITGAIFGAVLAFVMHPELEEPPLSVVYIPALAGAVLGAVSAFAIAKALRPVAPPTVDDDRAGHGWDRHEGEDRPGFGDRPRTGEPYITERPAPLPPRPDDRIRE